MPLPEFELPDPDKVDKAQDVAAEDAKFEVEIEDDTPIQDRRRPDPEGPPEDPTDDELASYDEKVQKRIKKFTRGYHDERRAKEEAQRERQAAEDFAKQVFEENKRLQQQLASGSKAFIETSKGAAEVELEAAERAYKQAYDDGNAEALVAAQKAITKATIKLERATDMKPIEVEDREFKAPAPAEPDKPKLTPRTQKWVDANSDWWGVDDEMTATAIGLDKKLARQYGPDYVGTKEYFKTIDKTMRKRYPEYFEDTQSKEEDTTPPERVSKPVDEDSEPPRRAQKITTVVASASRSTPPNRIRLTASQAAIARRIGVPLEEYAKQVAQLKRG